MANFTPQMLRDLLASPDPKDQELAQQLSAQEFANETGRLANYPPPAGPQVAGAPVLQPPPAPDQSALNNQYVQGNIGPGGSGGMTVSPAPPAVPAVQTVQPPTNVGGPTPEQMAAMNAANAPAPAQPQELQPNQFKNETTGKITTLSPPGAGPAAGAPAAPGAGQEPGVRVLDQMLQANGQIFQLIEKETPTGMVRTTRFVLPDSANPSIAAQMKLDQGKANLAHTQAETGSLNKTPAQKADEAFQIEKAKLKAQNSVFGDMTAGAQGTPGSPAVTGDAVLKSLPAGIAVQVQKLAEGKQAFPTGFAMKSPYWQNMVSLVAQYDPSFDAVNFNKRNQTATAFAKGKQADAVRAVNQTLYHMGGLADNIESLSNFNGMATPLNYIVNPAQKYLGGDPRQGTFEQTAHAVGSELRKVFSNGGTGSLQELQQWEDTLPVNGSQVQQTAYLKNGLNLLQGAMSALDNQYKEGMGNKASINDLITPIARKVIDRISGSGTPTPAAPGAAPAAQPAVPPMGTIKGGYIFKGGNPASPSSWMRQ
jgi:hypothetical protein